MNELRSAFRALRATPLVTAVAILSLALGIGANTAIFSIVDSVMLRSLPVEHAPRLAVLRSGEFRGSWTNPIWEAVRARPELFDGAFAAGRVSFNAAERGEVDLVDGAYTSGAYFDVLGVRPARGRFFTEADDRRGGGPDGPVAVLSHAFWQERFGGDPAAVGRSITLSGVSFAIVGVAAPGFFGHEVGRTVSVYVPLGTEPLVRGAESYLDRRSTWWMPIFVRLKSGQEVEAATAAIQAVQPRIRDETMPTDWRPQDLERYLAEPFRFEPASAGTSSLRSRYQRPLYALLGVVALTLLIACGNIANLMLARASARRHEFAVRTALGASRWRIARQLLGESLLLSAIGATLGTLFAIWFSRVIVSQIATSANRLFLDIGIDWTVLGFTGLVAVLTTLLCGVAPTLLASRTPPMDALKDQGRGSSSGGAARVAGSLVLAQVSLSLLLLVAAGLFIRTFTTLADVRLGFAPDGVLVANIGATRAGVEPAARAALYARVLEAARGVPGVAGAGFSVITPVSNSQWNGSLEFPGKPDLTEEQRGSHFNFLSEGWFATMQTRIIAGRDFDSRDRIGAGRRALVNRTFSEKYFDGENPIGKPVLTVARPGEPSEPIEIIGLVDDAVYTDLREPIPPTMYQPFSQLDPAPSSVTLSLRTLSAEPAAVASAVTAALARVNPDLSVSYRPLSDYVDAALSQERLIAMLSAFFGGLALLLAALGLYGVTSYAVVRRRGELGIRMALGASPGAIVRIVLRRAGALVLGGILLGGLASWWASRFVSSLLFGVTATDPVTVGVAMAVLALVGVAAGWVPARRAARIDPAEVLREG